MYYAYDLIDCDVSNWYGVVLRNFTDDYTNDDIKKSCSNITNGVNYVVGPMRIKKSNCAIVVLNNLEEAENLCHDIKKRESAKPETNKQRRIKAHLHPRSCKYRKTVDSSHYSHLLSENAVAIRDNPYNHVSFLSLMISKNASAIASKPSANMNEAMSPVNHNRRPEEDKKLTKRSSNLNEQKTYPSSSKNKNIYTSLLSSLVPQTVVISPKDENNVTTIEHGTNNKVANLTKSSQKAKNNTPQNSAINIVGRMLELMVKNNSTVQTPDSIQPKEEDTSKGQNPIALVTNSNESNEQISTKPSETGISVKVEEQTLINLSSGSNLAIPNQETIVENITSTEVVAPTEEAIILVDDKEAEFFKYDFKEKYYYDTYLDRKLQAQREQERQRERERDREKDRDRDRERDKYRDRYRDRERQSSSSKYYYKQSSYNRSNCERYNKRYPRQNNVIINNRNIVQHNNPTIINNVNINMIQHGNLNLNPSILTTKPSDYGAMMPISNIIIQNNGQVINKMRINSDEKNPIRYSESIIPPREESMPPLPKEAPKNRVEQDSSKMLELLKETKMNIEMDLNNISTKGEPGQILSPESSDNERRRPKRSSRKKRRYSSSSRSLSRSVSSRNKKGFTKRKRSRSRSRDKKLTRKPYRYNRSSSYSRSRSDSNSRRKFVGRGNQRVVKLEDNSVYFKNLIESRNKRSSPSYKGKQPS